uniref:Cytochrome b561 domain-containing protein n=1 Tax=Chenopodium quinoa TaxID=63459 RepID=A0A803N0K8_CHEQI
MDAIEREWYRRRASSITPVAHFFGILSIILLLVWLLHYRGGLGLDSDNPYRILNVHIFLMFFGFIFFAGQAITLGIIGVYAAFKYHYKANVTNMYSLHSWIGLGTFIVYGIQWFFGFVTFWLPRPGATRARLAPWHVCFGRALLYFAICTAETGLMQLFTILKLASSSEGRLINFTGLAILIFGISVDLVIALSHYY